MTILYVLIAILLISFLVIVHELGHYTAGRLTGLPVHEFGIGFGKRILSAKRNGIIYSLRLIPFGGFVSFAEGDDENAVKAFYRQAVWKRLVMTLSGPFMNFVVAFLIFDAGFLSFDLGLNYSFSRRISYPLFGHLRTTALAKVFQMPLEWHHQNNAGTLVGEVNNGVGKVVQTTEGISRELCPAIIQTLFSLVRLFLFSPLTTPPIFISLVLFIFLTIAENRRRQPLAKARYKNYARDFGLFAESVESIQPVVQYGQTGRVLRKYRALQQEIVQGGLEEARIANRYGWWRNMLLSLAKRGCQGFWFWQFRHNALDAAMIMYLNMLTEQLLASFGGYASLIERIFDGLEPTRSLLQMLDEKPSIADPPDAAPVAVAEQAGFLMHDVRFGYRRGQDVLCNFNMHVEPGEIVGIVGRSGCGKTTIHNLLSRMYEVQQGNILVCGTDVREWPLEQLRGLFSYVSQNGGIFFSGTPLLDVIRFTRPEASFEEVMEAARTACIHDDIMRMPQKYRTRIGQGGLTLSKGQQQRVALAQALLALDADRRILILDEFTSALDSETEEHILANLQPYLAGRTVIIIAHRLSTLRKIADRIVVLDETGIAEEGSHAELMREGGWYARMARLQATDTTQPAPVPDRPVLVKVG
jgi:ABC-type multidrug transport system fused ATPase/permease subunit